MKYPESYLLPPARILPQRELDAVKIEGQNLLGEVTAGIYNVFDSYHGVGRFKTQSGEAPKGMHLRLASLKELDDALEFTRLYGPISEKFIYETKGKLKYSVQLKEFWRLQRCLLETLQLVLAYRKRTLRFLNVKQVIGRIETLCRLNHGFPFQALPAAQLSPRMVAVYLMQHINDQFADTRVGIAPQGLISDSESHYPTFGFHLTPQRGLISACYLMLSWDLAERADVVACKNDNCDSPYFTRVRANKLYCSSTCALRTAKRNWARRGAKKKRSPRQPSG